MTWGETDIRSWVWSNNRIKTVDSTQKKTTQNPYCTHNFLTKWGESGEGNVQSCPSSHVEHNKGDSLSSSHVLPVISNDNYLDYSQLHTDAHTAWTFSILTCTSIRCQENFRLRWSNQWKCLTRTSHQAFSHLSSQVTWNSSYKPTKINTQTSHIKTTQVYARWHVCAHI